MINPPSCQVLIVEDNPDVRTSYTMALDLNGYSSMEAENGRSALHCLKEKLLSPPNLILLDLMMPVMDGWTFLRERESDPAIRDIPVVVCTASPEKVPRGVRYLKKPIDLDRLIAVLDEYCETVSGGQ